MLKKLVAILVFVAAAGGLGYAIVARLRADPKPPAVADELKAVPVEVAPVEHGAIADRRVVSGTLLARSSFVVAPKVAGRIESLEVDLADPVAPGDVVAKLDDDEFQQAVAQAQAELEVARAQLTEAQSALDVAQKEYDRVRELQERQIASVSEHDVAQADLRAKQAQVEVAAAQVQRAEAALASQKVRLGYTDVVATWAGDDTKRVVAQRYVDPGATVRANDPIVTIVDLSTVRAVLYVTERDYARLQVGQRAEISTDAFPGETFVGHIARLAPVFEETSRQARVEVDVPNPEGKLKPGMYVRTALVLAEAKDANVVPAAALVKRGEGTGVFAVDAAGERVRFVAVRTGITSGERVQVFGDGLTDSVVTLGQQLLEDGSIVHVHQAGVASQSAHQ